MTWHDVGLIEAACVGSPVGFRGAETANSNAGGFWVKLGYRRADDYLDGVMNTESLTVARAYIHGAAEAEAAIAVTGEVADAD